MLAIRKFYVLVVLRLAHRILSLRNPVVDKPQEPYFRPLTERPECGAGGGRAPGIW